MCRLALRWLRPPPRLAAERPDGSGPAPPRAVDSASSRALGNPATLPPKSPIAPPSSIFAATACARCSSGAGRRATDRAPSTSERSGGLRLRRRRGNEGGVRVSGGPTIVGTGGRNADAPWVLSPPPRPIVAPPTRSARAIKSVAPRGARLWRERVAVDTEQIRASHLLPQPLHDLGVRKALLELED